MLQWCGYGSVAHILQYKRSLYKTHVMTDWSILAFWVQFTLRLICVGKIHIKHQLQSSVTPALSLNIVFTAFLIFTTLSLTLLCYLHLGSVVADFSVLKALCVVSDNFCHFLSQAFCLSLSFSRSFLRCVMMERMALLWGSVGSLWR